MCLQSSKHLRRLSDSIFSLLLNHSLQFVESIEHLRPVMLCFFLVIIDLSFHILLHRSHFVVELRPECLQSVPHSSHLCVCKFLVSLYFSSMIGYFTCGCLGT